MVIFTAKVSKSKLLAVGLILLAAVCVLILTISGCSKKNSTALASNEDRVAYIQSFGWAVNPEPVQTQQVRVPETMNDVLQRYNEVQLQQGFDLTQYLGKSARRYVYLVTNYPDAPGEVKATLVLLDDKLIAADLSCSEDGGFVKPLSASASR